MNRGEYTTEIYDLLYFCEKYKAGKKVLDCGAGGSYPKLTLFGDTKYELFGIDSDENSLQMAEEFAERKNIEMHLQKADIREIPYHDDHFDIVFSYNTIFHMKKVEIEKAVNEVIRVLRPEGIGFINFLDIEDDIHKTDIEDGPGEFITIGEGYEVIHTLLSTKECESMLNGVKILEKQRKFIDCFNREEPYRYVYLDYFFQKNK